MSTKPQPARMIDLTPSWKACLPIYVEVYHTNKDPKIRADAFSELQRMADLADLYVAEHKAK
jgi:hypothetical protein